MTDVSTVVRSLSPSAETTSSALVCRPVSTPWAVRLTVAESPTSIVPRSQVATPSAAVPSSVADTKLMPSGSVASS